MDWSLETQRTAASTFTPFKAAVPFPASSRHVASALLRPTLRDGPSRTSAARNTRRNPLIGPEPREAGKTRAFALVVELVDLLAVQRNAVAALRGRQAARR